MYTFEYSVFLGRECKKTCERLRCYLFFICLFHFYLELELSSTYQYCSEPMCIEVYQECAPVDNFLGLKTF